MGKLKELLLNIMLLRLASDLSQLRTSGSHMMNACADVAKTQLNLSSALYISQFADNSVLI